MKLWLWKSKAQIVFRADASGKHITNAICSPGSSGLVFLQTVGFMEVAFFCLSVWVFMCFCHTLIMLRLSLWDAHFLIPKTPLHLIRIRKPPPACWPTNLLFTDLNSHPFLICLRWRQSCKCRSSQVPGLLTFHGFSSLRVHLSTAPQCLSERTGLCFSSVCDSLLFNGKCLFSSMSQSLQQTL